VRAAQRLREVVVQEPRIGRPRANYVHHSRCTAIEEERRMGSSWPRGNAATARDALRQEAIVKTPFSFGSSSPADDDRTAAVAPTTDRPTDRPARAPRGDRPPSGAQDAWESLMRVLEDAAADPAVAHGMSRAGVRVRLYALDLPEEAVVLECQNDRFELLEDGPADTELGLATEDVARLAEGKLRTAMAIATGRATYRGPIRQFLRVLPVMQAMVNPPVEMGTNHQEI
jgi:putative sterol carrier protein